MIANVVNVHCRNLCLLIIGTSKVKFSAISDVLKLVIASRQADEGNEICCPDAQAIKAANLDALNSHKDNVKLAGCFIKASKSSNCCVDQGIAYTIIVSFRSLGISTEQLFFLSLNFFPSLKSFLVLAFLLSLDLSVVPLFFVLSRILLVVCWRWRSPHWFLSESFLITRIAASVIMLCQVFR